MAKLADKYAIGTEHVIDGETIIVEEATKGFLCKNCAFSYDMGYMPCCLIPPELKVGRFNQHVICYACERTDGKNIIFRRKEQQ